MNQSTSSSSLPLYSATESSTLAKRAKCCRRGLVAAKRLNSAVPASPSMKGLGDAETQQPVRILDGEGDGDTSAEIVADHMDARDAEPIHQRPHVSRHDPLVVARRRRLRGTGAAQVGHDQPIALAERGHDGGEGIAGLGKAVQQHDRRRARRADVAVIERHTVDR